MRSRRPDGRIGNGRRGVTPGRRSERDVAASGNSSQLSGTIGNRSAGNTDVWPGLGRPFQAASYTWVTVRSLALARRTSCGRSSSPFERLRTFSGYAPRLSTSSARRGNSATSGSPTPSASLKWRSGPTRKGLARPTQVATRCTTGLPAGECLVRVSWNPIDEREPRLFAQGGRPSVVRTALAPWNVLPPRAPRHLRAALRILWIEDGAIRLARLAAGEKDGGLGAIIE